MKHLILVLSTVFVSFLTGCDDYAKYVDVFTGTAGTGHTFPAASMPFGLVQAGPDTGNGSWDYCSGYAWKDRSIIGFTQDHLNGTGCPDLGDLRLMPFSDVAEREKAPFDKVDEQAAPGWYSVKFKSGIRTEIAAARHSAIYRFTFAKGPKRLLVDTQYGIWAWGNENSHLVSSDVKLEGKTGLSGLQSRHRWTGRELGFVVTFDTPCASVVELPRAPKEKAPKYVFDFDLPDGATLAVKLALSSTGPVGAKKNLAAEIPDWNLDRVAAEARTAWNGLFSRATIEGTETEKKNWYTSLYHLYLQPNDIADVGETPFYSTLSLWDTFRAAHPLYTVFTPEVVGDVVNSMLRHAKDRGRMPIWALWGNETQCMIGNHSIPVVVDWFFKTLGAPEHDRVDWNALFEAMKDSVTVNHPKGRKENWDLYDKYGYYPFDVIKGESVSRTLECSYDDACLARMATALGRADDAAFFSKRAGFWKNVFDPSIGFARGKDTTGAWRTPFDPFAFGHGRETANDFTEGNAFQYTWHVLQDPAGLIERLGGKAATVKKLDELFKTDAKLADKKHSSDISGLIGQYVHGNEPSHHVIYFYTLAGRPDRAAECLREVFDRFYFPRPDGLCGNDDCGQMSAWYLFSAMGFYPFDPASGEYVIGAPQLPKVTLALPNGKAFTVVAENLSVENKYVRSVKLNGKHLAGVALKHADLMAGGELVFEMTDKPVVPVRAGSFNIRTSGNSDGWVADKDTPNQWIQRKDDVAALLRKLDWDVFGLQEVCPDQLEFLREKLPEWEFVGVYRNADCKTGEASPVAYRKSRFESLKKGTFWLSETPDVPGVKGWGAACPRVCSYLILRDKLTDNKFCFANTHTDHVSEQARLEGMKLIVNRMKEFGAGCPIVFTGDHNCCSDEPPAQTARTLLRDCRGIAATLKGPHDTFQNFGRRKDGDPVVHKGKRHLDYCIDYIYVSDGTQVRDFTTYDDKRPGTDLYPSDHFPVGATLVLPDCPCRGGIAPFKPGERVCFFGDSITHGGGYVAYLQLFQNLRRPGCGTRIMNVGVGGDTAAGGIRRLEPDLLAQRPDRVFVMFGMNDVRRDNWANANPTDQQKKARQAALDAYAANQRTLAGRLVENGVEAVLVTPSPYDQYSCAKEANLACCNEPGLSTCAQIVRDLAAEKGLPLLEFHAPLTDLQKRHADHVFCVDRVHPGADGHLIMAALVLEAMRVSPFVAQTVIEAAEAEAVKGGIAFDYAPNALPFPKLPEYERAEKFHPLTERLNREMLSVKGLATGGEHGDNDARELFSGRDEYEYALAFDGRTVAKFTAADLAAGVNIALLDTPNQRLAQDAAKVAEELHQLERAKRQNALIECRLRDNKVDCADFVAADRYLDSWLAQCEERKDRYLKTYRDWVRDYRAFRTRVAEEAAREDGLRDRLNAVRPVASRVSVVR